MSFRYNGVEKTIYISLFEKTNSVRLKTAWSDSGREIDKIYFSYKETQFLANAFGRLAEKIENEESQLSFRNNGVEKTTYIDWFVKTNSVRLKTAWPDSGREIDKVYFNYDEVRFLADAFGKLAEKIGNEASQQ